MRNRDNYPIGWNDIIRPDILKRDKYKCRNCGAIHRKSYVFNRDGTKFLIPDNEIKEWKGYGDKAYKVHLQIAHLDWNPSNNDYENLKAFCVKCHLNYDRAHNKIMRITKTK